MGYFQIYDFNENLYQFKDSLGVLSTLIIGDKKACLIDTCYGISNLYEEVRKITDKELIVINTHGHMDHASGNFQFKEVYIHEKDLDLIKHHTSLTWRQKNINSAKRLNVLPENFNEEEYLQRREGNLKFVNYFDKFDLGNLTIEVLPLAGHTKGSICLYVKEWKLMVTSDGACPFVYMFFNESTSVEEYIESLENLLKYDFNEFLVGHGVKKLLPKSRMEEFLKVAKEIDLEKSIKVNASDEGIETYCYANVHLYDQNGAGVVFTPSKLKK